MSKIVVEKSEIVRNKSLGQGYHVLTISPFSKLKAVKPGQFLHIKIPGSNIFFRRAFSVYDTQPEQKSFDIIFKIFGRGTTLMGKLREGDSLDVLGPLGNGFKDPLKSETVILAGGGIGMPPMYLMAKHLIENGIEKSRILFFYGGNTRDDLVDLARIRRLGVQMILTTMDGSEGYKGLITSAIQEKIQEIDGKKRIYSCGPEGMLKAVDSLAQRTEIPGQVSLEAPMPCGIGVCLGCILPLREGGYTRVCREGPVYDFGEVLL